MKTTIKTDNHLHLFRFMREQAESLHHAYHALVPVIGFVRDGNVIGMAGVPCGDQAHVMLATTIGRLGYDADGIVVIHFGYSASSMSNPLTGKTWTLEEMEDVFVNDGGLGGLVTEVLVGVYVSRNGSCEMFRSTYRFDGRKFHWDNDEVLIDGEDGADVQGVFPDALKIVIHEPATIPGAREVGDDIDDMAASISHFEPRLARDLSTSALMIEAKFVPLWNDGKSYFKL